MTQDPSDRAPADATAAPEPDSTWAPPPSWPPAAPSTGGEPADPTRVIETSAAGGQAGTSSFDPPSSTTDGATTPSQGGGDDPAPTAADQGTAAADTDQRTWTSGPASGYAAPAAGGYAAPGHDASGYGTSYPAYGAPAGADPAAAYGGYGGYPVPGQPDQGYGPGYPSGGYGYPSGGYGYPGYPQYYAPPTNTMAILSLVFIVVFPPLGLVFGLVARSQIKRTARPVTAWRWPGSSSTGSAPRSSCSSSCSW